MPSKSRQAPTDTQAPTAGENAPEASVFAWSRTSAGQGSTSTSKRAGRPQKRPAPPPRSRGSCQPWRRGTGTRLPATDGPGPSPVRTPRLFHQPSDATGGAAGLAVQPVPVLRQQRDFPGDDPEFGRPGPRGGSSVVTASRFKTSSGRTRKSISTCSPVASSKIRDGQQPPPIDDLLGFPSPTSAQATRRDPSRPLKRRASARSRSSIAKSLLPVCSAGDFIRVEFASQFHPDKIMAARWAKQESKGRCGVRAATCRVKNPSSGALCHLTCPRRRGN